MTENGRLACRCTDRIDSSEDSTLSMVLWELMSSLTWMYTSSDPLLATKSTSFLVELAHVDLATASQQLEEHRVLVHAPPVEIAGAQDHIPHAGVSNVVLGPDAQAPPPLDVVPPGFVEDEGVAEMRHIPPHGDVIGRDLVRVEGAGNLVRGVRVAGVVQHVLGQALQDLRVGKRELLHQVLCDDGAVDVADVAVGLCRALVGVIGNANVVDVT